MRVGGISSQIFLWFLNKVYSNCYHEWIRRQWGIYLWILYLLSNAVLLFCSDAVNVIYIAAAVVSVRISLYAAPQAYDCKSVIFRLTTVNTLTTVEPNPTTINSHDSSSFTLIHILVSNRAKTGLHVIVKLLWIRITIHLSLRFIIKKRYVTNETFRETLYRWLFYCPTARWQASPQVEMNCLLNAKLSTTLGISAL